MRFETFGYIDAGGHAKALACWRSMPPLNAIIATNAPHTKF
jgi:hypothetical protein